MNYFPNRLMADNRQRICLGTSKSDDGSLSVSEYSDGSFDIEWDEKNPDLAFLNDMSEDDIIESLKEKIEEESTSDE